MNDKTILLVEDNSDDEVLTIRALRQSQILNPVVVVHDGLEALDYLYGTGIYQSRERAPCPALILLDLKLPKLDGLGVLRRIRADARTRLLLVVILTSSREATDVLTGYQLGANSYIRKPVDYTQFVESVKSLSQYWLVLNEPPPLA